LRGRRFAAWAVGCGRSAAVATGISSRVPSPRLTAHLRGSFMVRRSAVYPLRDARCCWHWSQCRWGTAQVPGGVERLTCNTQSGPAAGAWPAAVSTRGCSDPRVWHVALLRRQLPVHVSSPVSRPTGPCARSAGHAPVLLSQAGAGVQRGAWSAAGQVCTGICTLVGLRSRLRSGCWFVGIL
jgi:hypothetical protein